MLVFEMLWPLKVFTDWSKKDREPPKSKINKDELGCKAEAIDSAPEDSILFTEEDNRKGKRKHPKSKLNKEEFCCKAEESAWTPEKPRELPEEDKRKGKETI